MDKKSRRILSAIMAFFSMIALSSDFNVLITDRYQLYKALDGNNILYLVVFFMFFYLYDKILQKTYSTKEKILSVCLGFVFSWATVVGRIIYAFMSLDSLFVSKSALLFYCINFIGLFCVFVCILIELIHTLSFNLRHQGNIKSYTFFQNNKKSIFAVWLLVICVWMIYYILYFPGITTWDTWYQYAMGLGHMPLNDQHPFMHTISLGLAGKVGTKLFGSPYFGIAIYSFIQMCIMALGVSYIIYYMGKRNIPLYARVAVLVFYTINPIIGFWSITVVKDVWMTLFLTIYMLFMIEITYYSEEFFDSKISMAFFLLTVLCIFFSKGTGIGMVCLTLPILFFFVKKHWKRLFALTIILILVYVSIRGAVMPMLNITKGHIREPLSVPLQQIARTVKYHDQDLTDEEKKTINEILPYDDLDELYNPILSDEVKNTLNEQVFKENISKYAKLWCKLGAKYPKTYLESLLCNSFRYWYPEAKVVTVRGGVKYSGRIVFYGENSKELTTIIYDEQYEKNAVEYPLWETAFKISEFINNQTFKIPIINQIFNIASYFWLSLILFAVAVNKKEYRLFSMFLVIFIVYLFCIMSPANGEMRYAYTVVFSMPIMVAFTLYTKKSDIKVIDKNEKSIDSDTCV